jgi:hypothetical protein
LTKEAQPNQLVEQSNRRIKARNSKKSRKFIRRKCLQTIRKVDTERSLNISNIIEENGMILNRDIFNHSTYRRLNLQMKYNFYSNQFAEPKEVCLQTLSTAYNI